MHLTSFSPIKEHLFKTNQSRRTSDLFLGVGDLHTSPLVGQRADRHNNKINRRFSPL